MREVKIIECPRDALQGIKTFIPTKDKLSYLQLLVNCGFHTLDVGSFVSPKAIPQMRDTALVLEQLDISKTNTKLLTIVANFRGAQAACQFSQVDYIGFPFSISEIFQMRNTHKTIQESFLVLEDILQLANQHNKEVVLYLSMGFGNPYGEVWNAQIVCDFVAQLADMGVSIISLSDTIGASTPEIIHTLFSTLKPAYPSVEFGAHLHTSPTTWYEKLNAAFNAGCSRFDGAIQGFGGCPMAMDALVGNMPTEKMLSYFTSKKLLKNFDWMRFESAHNQASVIFQKFH